MSDKAKINLLLASLGLTYTAVFVPYSQSPNAQKKPKTATDFSINWKVWITRGTFTIETNYFEGIASLPKFGVVGELNHNSVHYFNLVKNAVESGKGGIGANLKPPELIDVLYCLVSDGDAIEYSSFEDWASCFGCNPDSREAEKTYRTCLELGLKLRSMLGDENLKAVREAYQDY